MARLFPGWDNREVIWSLPGAGLEKVLSQWSRLVPTHGTNCRHLSTIPTNAETLVPTIAKENKNLQSVVIDSVEIQSPFFASFLATTYPLNLTPASKHHLAVYLKGTVEASCHAFLTVHEPHILKLLSLHTHDIIDINVWITLIGHLLLHQKLPFSAFASSAIGESPWPSINTRYSERIDPKTDTIARLRHIVVHRWDFNTHLLRDAISFLALLKDSQRLSEVETVLLALHESEDAPIPQPICTTPIALITRLVEILERTLHAFALAFCPTILKPGDIRNPHAIELHHLAAALESLLAPVPSLPDKNLEQYKKPREIPTICRALRNAAAHHTPFTPEAIQLRRWSRCPCPYDACEDPYRAMVDDAVKVATWLGNLEAVREIELAALAINNREDYGKEEEETDLDVAECIAMKAEAEDMLRSMHYVDTSWGALWDRVGEAAAYWGNRAAESALTVRVHLREVDLGPGGIGIAEYVERSSGVMSEDTGCETGAKRWEECTATLALRKRELGASRKSGFSGVTEYLKRSSGVPIEETGAARQQDLESLGT